MKHYKKRKEKKREKFRKIRYKPHGNPTKKAKRSPLEGLQRAKDSQPYPHKERPVKTKTPTPTTNFIGSSAETLQKIQTQLEKYNLGGTIFSNQY